MLTRRPLLPPRRKRPKSGIERAPQRIFPRHRRWVKSHRCCVPGCPSLVVDFAHIHSVGAGGHDKDGVPLCRLHHSEQHQCGIHTFQDRHGVDLEALAAELVRTSPDAKLRVAVLELSLDSPTIPVFRPAPRPAVMLFDEAPSPFRLAGKSRLSMIPIMGFVS